MRGAQRNPGRPLLRFHNSCPAESRLPHCSSNHPQTMLQTHPACTRRFGRLAAARVVGFRVQRESARREGQARGHQEPVGRDFGEAQHYHPRPNYLNLHPYGALATRTAVVALRNKGLSDRLYPPVFVDVIEDEIVIELPVSPRPAQ
jgi:hypothetical protein